MPVIDLYTNEAHFNAARDEYKSIMKTVKYDCLDETKNVKECQRAAELNADMQTYLLQMSNALANTPPNLKQQQELLNVVHQLELDIEDLLSKNNSKQEQLDDLDVFANMYYSKTLTWMLTAITILGLLIFSVK
jgi:superfamily II RNA helicase